MTNPAKRARPPSRYSHDNAKLQDAPSLAGTEWNRNACGLDPKFLKVMLHAMILQAGRRTRQQAARHNASHRKATPD